MQLFFSKKYIILFVLCVSLFSYGQDTLMLKKGIIVDSLLVPETESTFTIYLPKAFDMNKTWPLLLGFDSNNKARNLTEIYKVAAEELGYVVAVTNFSKEHTIKEKMNYVSVFMNHIFSLFPIQRGRVYVTAIKDDAKLVSLLPIIYPKEIFGVIAVEDSYYYDNRVQMGKNFTHFGLVNINNYRYKDFRNNLRYLKRKAIPAYLLTYEGELPDQNLIKNALTTFTLQSMLKGRTHKDSVWVQEQYQKDLRQVKIYQSSQEYLLAYEEVKRIRNLYRLFFQTDSLKEKEKEIRKIPGYKKQRKLRNKFNSKENILRETFLWSIEEDVEVIAYDNLGWWQYQMSEMDTLIKSKERYASAMGYRVKGYVKYLVNELKTTLPKKEINVEKRMFLNILSTIIDKKDFESYRTVISLSAQDQDYNTALFYLNELLQNGYKDIDALYTIEGTLALKLSKEYNGLIKKHLGTARYFFPK
ncbi:hypothetical protein [Aquimarina sp. MMG016]|uniref:hypothetical protein n=1 Tax=Aquimarina sp. MMG016 TaxID=2822690 RepID=UPI001B3A3FC3|nr:hypothetical protein [Aquimarina sp. MMG016]MBQ4820388.1 hypothetical protein [Aquimarina sp. MMG016]